MIPPKLIQRDKALLTQVQRQSADAVAKILPDLEQLTQQGAGAVVRKVATGTIQTFGNVASVASTSSYGELRAAALPSEKALKLAPVFAVDDSMLEPVVGYTMSKFSQGAFVEAGMYLASGVSLAVANAYRDNGKFLSDNDPQAESWQRVASPNACAFCAFAATSAGISAGANDFDGFHDHCTCNVVPVFRGQSAFRPDYYDAYEEASLTATDEIRVQDRQDRRAFFDANPSARRKDYFKAYPDNSVTTKNILARMRATGAYH